MSLEYNYAFFSLGELVVLVYPIILRAGVYKFIHGRETSHFCAPRMRIDQ